MGWGAQASDQNPGSEADPPVPDQRLFLLPPDLEEAALSLGGSQASEGLRLKVVREHWPGGEGPGSLSGSSLGPPLPRLGVK